MRIVLNSINYEVGVKTDHDRLRTQASVSWLDIQDNIVSITTAPNTFASANQDSLIQGMEFSGEFLLDRSWSLYGNVWQTVGDNLVTESPLSLENITDEAYLVHGSGVLGTGFSARMGYSLDY